MARGERVEYRQLLFNRCRVSVLQDEIVLETGCNVDILNTTELILHLKWLQWRVNIMPQTIELHTVN